ncbi:MAG TPA: hypothetical protein VF710_23450 [Longimicrobium sp.]
MTVVARRLASVPARSAVDTWDAIVELIAPDPKSSARTDLNAAAGVACSLIAGEMSAPIVVYGSGPRLRVYCLYGDAAIDGDDVTEGPLTYVPTEGDWHMSLPCPEEELDWVQRRLRSSMRVSARDDRSEVGDEKSEDRGARGDGAPVVDLDAFLRG